MTRKKIATIGFAAVVAGSAIMTAWKCHSGKTGDEGYHRVRRGGKRYTVVPSRFL